MKACDCGSRSFRIPTVFYGVTRIELDDDDTDEYEVTDSHAGDGEWGNDTEDKVSCAECGKEIPYREWAMS